MSSPASLPRQPLGLWAHLPPSLWLPDVKKPGRLLPAALKQLPAAEWSPLGQKEESWQLQSVLVWCVVVLRHGDLRKEGQGIPGKLGQAARLALMGLQQGQCSALRQFFKMTALCLLMPPPLC